MSFDYSSFSDLAVSMINQFGRSVTLRKRTTTVATPDVPSDVTVTNTDTTVLAVRTEFRADQIDGEQILAQDRLYLVAAADVSEAPEPSWQLIDGSLTYTVLNVERTAPGDTDVLYQLHGRA